MNRIKGEPRLPAVLFMRLFIITCVLCVTAALAQSQECLPPQYMDEHEPQRRALVIGNATYTNHANVTSAATDAKRMKERLADLGFEVHGPLIANTRDDFSKALTDFRASIGEGDLVVFYYSGHGFSYGADGFLAPTNLPKSVTETELPDAAMAVDSVRYLLESRKPGLVIMILDACRTIGDFVIPSPHANTPADGSASGTNSNGPSSAEVVNLAKPGLPMPGSGDDSVNTIVAFAADYGHVAEGNNTPEAPSTYTSWLIAYLMNEGESVLDVFSEVRADVIRTTQPVQKPIVYLSSSTNPFLRPTTRNLNEDKQAWCVALGTNEHQKIQRYTLRHSVTRHTAAARRWLQQQVVSGARGYTFISPVAVERAWQASPHRWEAVRRLESLAFAFPRSMDASWETSVATATNADVGVVAAGTTTKQLGTQRTGEKYLANTWGIDSTTPADRKLAFTIASLDLHETIVATINLIGRAEPNAKAPLVSRIARGTQLQIQGLAEGADESVWVKAVTESNSSPFFVKIDPALLVRRPVAELGQPVKEVVVNAVPNGHPDLVNPEPLRTTVNELKNQGWEISWVSLATGAINKEDEQATRDARLDHAQYLLKQMGIPGVRMTSVTAVSDFKNDGVRVRIFGVRK